jgi:integrase
MARTMKTPSPTLLSGKLTDERIGATEPGPKAIKLSDGHGLQLVVSPAGGKVWKLAYRFDGRQRELTIGPYPLIGIQAARTQRDAARTMLIGGKDPGTEKQIARRAEAERNAATFAVMAAEMLEKKRHEKRAPATLSKLEWLYGIANAEIGRLPIAKIKAPDVHAVLRKVERRGRYETARKLRAVMGEVFRYAIAIGIRDEFDPTSALTQVLVKPTVRPRASIVDPAAFGELLRAIDAFSGQPTTIAALKLMALLFPRPGELRQAEWSEFDFAQAVWSIPGTRMKMRRDHRVPLPRQALEILLELKAITGRGTLVFPGIGMSGGVGRKVGPRPLSEGTMTVALRRLGYDKDTMTAHGFRATASTLLNESGLWSRDAIERALAHQEPDPVRRAYARGEHWDERVRMAQWWADEIDRMRANVRRPGREDS